MDEEGPWRNCKHAWHAFKFFVLGERPTEGMLHTPKSGAVLGEGGTPEQSFLLAEFRAGLRRVQIRWPSNQADAQRRTIAQRALLQGWLADVHPTVFSTLSLATAVQVHALSASTCHAPHASTLVIS